MCLCTGYKKKSLYFFQNYKNSKGRWLEQNKAKLTVSVKNCFPFFPFPFLYMSFLSWIYEMVTFLSVFFPSVSFFSWSFYSLPFFLLYFAYPCLYLNSVFWQSFFFFVRCWFNFCACLLTCFWIYLNCFSSTKSIMLRLWVTYFCQNVELVGHFFHFLLMFLV